MDKRVISKKIENISQYLTELEPITKYSFKEFLSDYYKLHTAERLIQLIIDTAYDINIYLIDAAGKPLPDDYYSSFTKLGGLKILSSSFSQRIAGATGLRNRLVHEYETIDFERVFKSLPYLLRNFKKYLVLITKYCKL